LSKNLFLASIFVITVSLFLTIIGEYQAFLTFWLAITLLLPPLLWSFKKPYITPKIFCLTAIFSQLLSIPGLYINKDRWAWWDSKPFTFMALETVPIFAKVALFLWAFVILFNVLYSLGGFKKLRNGNALSGVNFSNTSLKDRFPQFDVNNNRNAIVPTLIALILISVLIPLSLWSYSQGIGMVGIEPPRMPYRLSGIIFYFTKFLTPIILGYLYLKSRRGWGLIFAFMIYALVLGVCSVSKGSVLFIMAPVVALAWVGRTYIKLIVSGLGSVVGVYIASTAREIVYVIGSNGVTANSNASFFDLIYYVLTKPDSRLWDNDFIPVLVAGIASRIEGFSNLIHAQYYDPDKVLEPFGFMLRMIWSGLANIDVDAHHMQWLGWTLPKEFYSGGSILSNAVLIGNAGLIWVVVSAFISALILLVSEKIVNKSVGSVHWLRVLRIPIIFYVTMLYFTHTSLSAVHLFILASLIITGLCVQIKNLIKR